MTLAWAAGTVIDPPTIGGVPDHGGLSELNREAAAALIDRLVVELHAGAAGWENTDLDAYVDALGGWLRGAGGYYRNNFGAEMPDNSWRVICDALEAARTYE